MEFTLNMSHIYCDHFENHYKCHSALRGAGYDQMMMDPETKKIKELFMERPIWSRHALIERSGIRAANLKKILPYIAFYWSTGPWKRMWHRLEPVFDPRIEKIIGRRLQTVDIREKSDEIKAARRTTEKLHKLATTSHPPQKMSDVKGKQLLKQQKLDDSSYTKTLNETELDDVYDEFSAIDQEK